MSWWPKVLLTLSHPPPTIEHPHSVNNLRWGSLSYTAMKCIPLFSNWVSCSQSCHYVLVYNFTNMHAMSYRSYYFNCSSRAIIEEPTLCCTITLLSAVSQFRSPNFLIPTAMSNSKSLNTSLLDVMMSSKNEGFFICYLSNLTIHIIFDAWWVSMNVGSKCPVAWNDSRHVSSWRFYLHCGIEETGSLWIICIIFHQVLRHQSEHRTSSMASH